MTVLVVDVGTSGVRAAIVDADANVEHVHYREVLPTTPAPGFVGYIVVAAVGTAINVAAGHGAPSPAQAIFAALWLALGGTLGGYVASWRAQKSRPSEP